MKNNKDDRRIAKRQAGKVVLIPCEGEVVERTYFRWLSKQFEARSLRIEIKTKKEIGGNSPRDILEYAKRAYKEFKYDQIFCVFDRDSHESYDSVIKEIEQLRNNEEHPMPIYAIRSAPCFEYWFLSHFKYTSSPFSRTPSKSTADHCVKALKKHIPDYDKKKELILKIFPDLFSRIETAIKNAKKIQTAGKKDGFDEPFTNVNEIIEYFRETSRKT